MPRQINFDLLASSGPPSGVAFNHRLEPPMKSIATLLVLSALITSAASIAAPPPSHPSADAAAGMLQLPKETSDADLPHKGKVITTNDTSQYTYIEVAQGSQILWLAAPTVALKKDNVIRFEDGAVMSNFHSKTLNRTFPSIMFISHVVLTSEKE